MNVGGLLPAASRQSPAMARKGAPFKVKRCFAFGYFVPVNSKNADAGTRQRCICEPAAFRSEVEHWATFRTGRGKAERHRCKLNGISGSAHDRRRIVNADVVCLRKIEFSLMCRIFSANDSIILQYSAHAICCS